MITYFFLLHPYNNHLPYPHNDHLLSFILTSFHIPHKPPSNILIMITYLLFSYILTTTTFHILIMITYFFLLRPYNNNLPYPHNDHLLLSLTLQQPQSTYFLSYILTTTTFHILIMITYFFLLHPYNNHLPYPHNDHLLSFSDTSLSNNNLPYPHNDHLLLSLTSLQQPPSISS
ncbi:unnamed protein product [Acanthosepion pharaonis]|uniref:Uncharacterized protein n=1 Tax=Acanthosepion pharaonis TaxID=158019 RepID=A0A812BMW8_ACAPH|nr:unnamed protein product [Sepia pharaonis]